MPQVWLPIVGYEDLFEVSDDGKVRSIRNGRILKTRVSSVGYERIVLWKSGKAKAFSVHRIVAFAFHGKPVEPRTDVAHNDGVRTNNCAENLRWATKSENQADRIKHGTAARPQGTSHGMAKLSNQQIISIREDVRKQRDIAKVYGVSQSLISLIKSRKLWAHI